MIEQFYGYLDKDWRTKKELIEWYKIMYHTKLNERMMRIWFERYNEKYGRGESELFIAHSQKGYLLTSDPEIIRKSLMDDYKRAMKLLVRNSRCTKALSEKNQLSLMPEEASMYETIMKLYES